MEAWIDRGIVLFGAFCHAANALNGNSAFYKLVWSCIHLVIHGCLKMAGTVTDISLVTVFSQAAKTAAFCVQHLPRDLCMREVLPLAKQLASLSQPVTHRCLGIALLGSAAGNKAIPPDTFVQSLLPGALALCQDVDWEVRAAAAAALAHIVPAACRTSFAVAAQSEYIQLLQDEDSRVVAAAMDSAPALLRSLPRSLRLGHVYPAMCLALERAALPACMPFQASAGSPNGALQALSGATAVPPVSGATSVPSGFHWPTALPCPVQHFTIRCETANTRRSTEESSRDTSEPSSPGSGQHASADGSGTPSAMQSGMGFDTRAQTASTASPAHISQHTGALLGGSVVGGQLLGLPQPALPFPTGVSHGEYSASRRAVLPSSLRSGSKGEVIRKDAASWAIRTLLIAHRLGDAVSLSETEFASAQLTASGLLHGTRSSSPSPKHQTPAPSSFPTNLQLPPQVATDMVASGGSDRSCRSPGRSFRGPLLKRGSSTKLGTTPASPVVVERFSALERVALGAAVQPSSGRLSTLRPKQLRPIQSQLASSPRESGLIGNSSLKSSSGQSSPSTPASGLVDLPQGTPLNCAAGPLLLAAHAAVASSLRHPSVEVRLQGLKYVPSLAQVSAAGLAHSTISVYLHLSSIDPCVQMRLLAAQIFPVWATQVLHGFVQHTKGVETAREASLLMLHLITAALVDPVRLVRQWALRSSHVWLPCFAALKARSTTDTSGAKVLHILLPYLMHALNDARASGEGGTDPGRDALCSAADWRSMHSCLAGLRISVSMCPNSELHDVLVSLTQRCLSWQGNAAAFLDETQHAPNASSARSMQSSTASTPRYHDDLTAQASTMSDSFPSISGVSAGSSKSPRSLTQTLNSAAAAAAASHGLHRHHMTTPPLLSHPSAVHLHDEARPTFPVPAGGAGAINLVWLWRFAATARSRQTAHAGIMRGLAVSSFARRRALLPICFLTSLRVFSRRAVKIELLPLILLQATADHVLSVRIVALKSLLLALAFFTEASDTDAVARIGDAALTSLLQRAPSDFNAEHPPAPSVQHLIMWQSAVAASVLQYTSAKAVLQALWTRRESEVSNPAPSHPKQEFSAVKAAAGISVNTAATRSVPRHPAVSAHTTPTARGTGLSKRNAVTPTASSTGGIASLPPARRIGTGGASTTPAAALLLPSRRSPALLKRRGPAVSANAVRAQRGGAASAPLTSRALPSIPATTGVPTPHLSSASVSMQADCAPEARVLASWQALLSRATGSIPEQRWQYELPNGSLAALHALVPGFGAAKAPNAESRRRGSGAAGGATPLRLQRGRRSSSSVSAAVLASDKFLQAESQRAAVHVREVCYLDAADAAGSSSSSGVSIAVMGQLTAAMRQPFWPWATHWSPGETLVGEGFLPPPQDSLAGGSPQFTSSAFATPSGGAHSPSALLPTEHAMPPFARLHEAGDEAWGQVLQTGGLASAAVVGCRPEEGVVLGMGVGGDLKAAADRLVVRRGGTGSLRSLLSVSSSPGGGPTGLACEGGVDRTHWMQHLLHWADDVGAGCLRQTSKVVASGHVSMHDAAAISVLPGAHLKVQVRGGLPVLGSAAHSSEVESTRQAAEALLREAAAAEEDAFWRVAVEGRRRLDMLRRNKDIPAGRLVAVPAGMISSGIVEFPPIRSVSLPVLSGHA